MSNGSNNQKKPTAVMQSQNEMTSIVGCRPLEELVDPGRRLEPQQILPNYLPSKIVQQSEATMIMDESGRNSFAESPANLWGNNSEDNVLGPPDQGSTSWPSGYDLCPTNKQVDDMIIDPKREVTFGTVENEGGDAFDLLTYLCEVS